MNILQNHINGIKSAFYLPFKLIIDNNTLKDSLMRTFLLMVSTTLIYASQSQATTISYFNSDFEQAQDIGSAIIDNNQYLSTNFGDPSLSNGMLRFNTGGLDTYEQVELNLHNSLGHTSYHVEFDLLTENLANSQWGFSTIFDTPIVQNLNFNNCCSNSVSTFNSQTSSASGQIGSLIDNQWMHVTIDIDLLAELWTVDISGVGQITTDFYSQSGGIESMRLGLSPAHGSINAPDPSINVYVDNLSVNSVPVPAAVWLFGSGLIGLAGIARRKKA